MDTEDKNVFGNSKITCAATDGGKVSRDGRCGNFGVFYVYGGRGILRKGEV